MYHFIEKTDRYPRNFKCLNGVSTISGYITDKVRVVIKSRRDKHVMVSGRIQSG